MHVADASLAAEVCANVTSEEKREDYIKNLKVAQEEQRRVFSEGRKEQTFVEFQEAYKNRFVPKHHVHDTPDFMDWEFTDTSKIWTGKGNRKHKNIRYLEAKKHYEEKLDEN